MADDEMVRQLQNDLGFDMSVLISAQDRKDQALQVLKSELMAKLDKEVKSLDDDSWMFDGPRSRINLISGRGGFQSRHSETSAHGLISLIAKIGLMAIAPHGPTQMVAVLLWPFMLKCTFSFRPLHRACTDMWYAVRLFFFQMGHITFDAGPASGGERWQRALRLVLERLVHARFSQSTGDSWLSLSTLAV